LVGKPRALPNMNQLLRELLRIQGPATRAQNGLPGIHMLLVCVFIDGIRVLVEGLSARGKHFVDTIGEAEYLEDLVVLLPVAIGHRDADLVDHIGQVGIALDYRVKLVGHVHIEEVV